MTGTSLLAEVKLPCVIITSLSSLVQGIERGPVFPDGAVYKMVKPLSAGFLGDSVDPSSPFPLPLLPSPRASSRSREHE